MKQPKQPTDYRNRTNIEEVPFRSLHQAYGEAYDRECARERHYQHGGEMMSMSPEGMDDYRIMRRFLQEAGDHPGTGNIFPCSGTVDDK